MGRRRVKEKHIPMSLSIPHALIQSVDSELSFKQSRSKWVQGAIKAKLNSSIDWDSIESKALIVMLFNRGVIDENTLRVMLQSVETEE